jgi:hypothetical protein
MKQVKERQAQQENERNEKNKPVKALWKSSQFKDVQSKLKESLQVISFISNVVFFLGNRNWLYLD